VKCLECLNLHPWPQPEPGRRTLNKGSKSKSYPGVDALGPEFVLPELDVVVQKERGQRPPLQRYARPGGEVVAFQPRSGHGEGRSGLGQGGKGGLIGSGEFMTPRRPEAGEKLDPFPLPPPGDSSSGAAQERFHGFAVHM